MTWKGHGTPTGCFSPIRQPNPCRREIHRTLSKMPTGPDRRKIFQVPCPVNKVQWLSLHCRQLECLLVTYVAEFGLGLLGPKSVKRKETYHSALLELANRLRCAFNFFVMTRFNAFLARARTRHSVGNPTCSSFRACS
jgi:hypothetical protein